jgi:hypothetical protein
MSLKVKFIRICTGKSNAKRMGIHDFKFNDVFQLYTLHNVECVDEYEGTHHRLGNV